MTVRRIDWGVPTRELVTRLIELAQGWVDGDCRAQAMADGLIAKIQDETIAKIVAERVRGAVDLAVTEDRSVPPEGLETAEDDRYGRFWCRTVENRDTEDEAIADGWAVVDRARGIVAPSDREDVPW